MSKSRARLLAELLNTEGRVKKDRSDLAGADSVIDLDSLPTITNAKLENSSITIAGEALSLGGTLSLNTGHITEHTNYKYYTDTRARASISVSGDTLSYNSTTGVITSTANNYSLPTATSSALGGVKIGFTEDGKNYPVELSNGQMYVNVPWVDTNTTYSVGDGGLTQNNFTNALKTKLDGIAESANNYTLSTATASALGGVKIGYTENGKNYPVELSEGQMYVNVPWTDTDTDTTYSTATSSVLGLVKIGYTENGKNYPVELSNGQMYVNVPWTDTDTDTTYSVGDGGLTQKNFTTALKTKLDNIAENANNYVLPFTDNSSNWNTAYSWGDHSTEGYATETYVGTQISNLVDSAPGTLDTLNELAAALGDDANFSTTVTNSIATKLPLAGGTMTGNIAFNTTEKGITWSMNTDGAYIKFFNTGDGDTDSRLEYGTTDNGNEYHRFMVSGTERLKITASGITATGYNKSNWDTAYGWGNHASAGYLTSSSGLNASNLTSGTIPNARLSGDVMLDGNAGTIDNSSQSFDDFSSTGIHYVSNFSDVNDTVANGPSASYPWGMLRVTEFINTNYAVQEYIPHQYHGDFTRVKWNGAWTGWRKTWTSANDGSGSGLDADTVDGIQGSSILQTGTNFGGDVSGTYNAIVVANNSHEHSQLYENSTITYGASYLQWTDLSGQNGTGANGNNPQNPTNDWYHHIIANHANSGGYYYDLSLPFHQDQLFFRRVTNGSQGSFRKVWHDANDGSGSGLDADLLDGVQAASFVRSDANDTLSGQYSFTKVNDHAIKVGTIRGTAVGSQSGEYIHMYERVHIGGPSGWGAASISTAPSYGLSTYGGANLATATGSVTISGNTAWHAGNDGTGSGLDADTVDGLQASSFVRSDTSDTMAGTLTLQSNSSGTAEYGRIRGYPNDNHFIVIRGAVANQTGLSITGAHQTTFVEHAENNDTTGWYFKSNQTGSYAEIARITRTGGMHLQGNKVWHAGNDGAGSGLDADTLDGNQSSFFVDTSNNQTIYGNKTFGGTILSNAYSSGDNWMPYTDGNFYFRAPNVYFDNNVEFNDEARVVTGSVSNASSTKGLMMDGNYQDGRYRHRWRKQDNGGGVPLYLDRSHGTAHTYSTVARFGPYSSNPEELEVYGAMKTNGQLVINQNIASPANYYSGLQVEVRATSGTAGIGLHRNGYSHVGIYTNTTNRLDFDFNSGDVYLHYNAGTLWGTGNDGSGSGLDADTVDGVHHHNHYGTGERQTIEIYGDSDKYYPVVISGASEINSEFQVWRGYNELAPSDWNTASHKGGLTLRYRVLGAAGWGGYPTKFHVYEAGEIYSTVLGGLNYTAHTMMHVIWLRGGGSTGARYHFFSNTDYSLQVFDDTSSGYTSGSGWLSYDSTNNSYDTYVNYRTLTERNSALQSEIINCMPVDTQTGKVRHGLNGIDPSRLYWNSTNDGSGSGLDADTLDSLDSSSFLRSDASDTASGSITFDGSTQKFRKNDATNYYTGSLMVESYGGSSSTATMGFHISGQVGNYLRMNSAGVLEYQSTFRAAGNLTTAGQLDVDSKRSDFGASSSWDSVGFGHQTNLHMQGHNQFWIGAGNGTWFTGAANSKSQASGLASDAGVAHDLLLSTMQADSYYDRGITFAVDSNGAGTGGWRLGKWHSGDARDSSKLVVDGGLFVKGGYNDEYDYYANDYSAYYSTRAGRANWSGDGGWQDPSITASTAIQIQSGNGGTNSRKPQLQFHQYGYGGIIQEYDGPNKIFHIKQTGDHRLNYMQLTTNYGNLQMGPMNSSYCHIYTSIGGGFYFNRTALYANGNTMWHAGNDGAGSGLDADVVDGIDSKGLMAATTSRTWTGLSANGAQARRWHVMRLYVCPAHWDGNHQNMKLFLHEETFESSYVEYHLWSDYNGGNQNTAMQLYVKDIGGYDHGRYKIVVGSPVSAGWNYSGQPTYYYDIYVDVAYYKTVTLYAHMRGHGYTTTTPTSGGAQTLVYTSPSVTNISDFSETRTDPHFGHYKIWNASNDGSGSTLDADLLDGQHGSYYNWRTWNADITWNTGKNILVSGESSIDISGSGYFQLWDSGTAAPFVKCDVGQTVEIGQAGSRGLYVYGSMTASGNVTAYSDIRLKENIEVIPDAVNKVQQLRGVTFTRNDQDDKEKRHAGVIAQEVEQVLPEVVDYNEEKDVKTVSYGNMVGLLIEAIKELKQEVDDLKAQLKEK